MNLEQRVQALEQEVQLLKAQIQTTLLDIQEHLLNGTYPVLRAEETASPTLEAAAPLPVKRVVIAESEPDEDPEMEAPIVEASTIRKVIQLEEETQPSQPDWDDWQEPQHQRDTNAFDWIELENWVSQKVEMLGIKRTRELIELYARQERFSRQERELLMQFVDIYDDDGEKSPIARPVVSSKQPMNGNPTIVPQTRAVVEEIRAELRQKRAATQAAPLNENQGLVLRLIAGILNAGDDTPNGHRR